jgi:hypothetical protein
MFKENRIDFARMYLNKGEPYTLRKFKKIFKREMEHRPDLYDVLDKDGKSKNKIRGINLNDPRAIVPKLDSKDQPKMPKDFAAKLEEWKKLNDIRDKPIDQDTWLKMQGFTDEEIAK